MKDKITDKAVIRIMLILTVFFAVFIVVYQALEKNVIAVPEKLVYINSSEITLPESFKDKIENGTFSINLNTASAEEFEQIPGIGPATAKKIINYRETIGSFKELEELLDIKGIGEKTFEKIRMYVYI